MNAISVQVQADLREAAAELTERDDVRAVVLWGGERVFAAGNDVKEMADLSYSDMVKVSASVSSATTAIARIPKPVVAAVNGYALGGGCELALAADLRFAAEDAVLGQPEVLLGIIPGAGGTQRLARLVGTSRAKDIIFTGRFVKADEALRIGMVDRVVPADKVLEESVAYAAQFSGAAALAVRAAKECIDRGSEVDLDTGLEIERQQFAGVFATEDRTRGITSFVENGPGKATFVGVTARQRPDRDREEDRPRGNEDPGDARPAGVAGVRARGAGARSGGAADRAGRQQVQRARRRRPHGRRAVDLDVFSRQDGIKQFRGRGRRGQERALQLGPRRHRLARGRPRPRPHHQALTPGRTAR